jgi:hypothetical protein
MEHPERSRWERPTFRHVAPEPAKELPKIVGVAEAEVLLSRQFVAGQEGCEFRCTGRATGMNQQRREVDIRKLRRWHTETVSERQGDARRPENMPHRLASTQVTGE